MQINVTQYLDTTASKFPDKIAVDDLQKSYTFLQLQQAAQQLACKIIDKKIINSPIPVFLPKSSDAVMAFAAVNYSGNFYVPVDTKSPDSRTKSIFDSLQPSVILTNTTLLEKVKSLYNGEIICIEEKLEKALENDKIKGTYNNSLCHCGLDPQSLSFQPIAACAAMTGTIFRSTLKTTLLQIIDTDPVYSIFTSGSTGNPKGVVISHRSVIDYIDWAIETFKIDEKTIIANQTPFYFDMSLPDLYFMFGAGATLYIVPDEYFIFPAKLIDFLNEKKINLVFWVPSVFISVVNYKLLEEKKPEYLEKILFGGEVMPNKHLNYWRKYLPNCLYANLYGPTEITGTCVCYIADREFSDEEPLPIGIPCKNTGILILNEKNEAAKINEQGELCVRGSSLALGYYNDPEKTSKVFVQNPLNTKYSETIYRTGDIAFWNERGEIMYVGRKDSQIKHNGYRIELGEIENAALNTGFVKTTCVVYNQNNRELVMFYEATEELKLSDFRKEMLLLLPKYMIPTKYIRLNKMPINANGKIDRLKLNKEING